MEERVKKMYKQVKNSPYVGNSLRYKFFREKRIKEKRVYYLVYEDLKSVLFVAIGGKKKQQETIDKIINKLPYFKKYIHELLN